MRLTLRTLLAYLDDILEPSQTKEIGNKLSESKFASDLVDRIRDVMRKRRLTAPGVEAGDDSLDANTVSEYLDNTLSPEQVTEVEKVCLESDIHLAEAAACHQILTLVLGEPVEIAPDSRRRMYGLVSQGSGDNQAAVAAQMPAEASKAVDDFDEDVATPQEKEQTETIGSALPDYLKPRPLWRRALALFGAALAISLFIALMVPDSTYKSWFGSGEAPTPVAETTPAKTGVKHKPSIGNIATKAITPVVAESSKSSEAGKAVGGPGVTPPTASSMDVPSATNQVASADRKQSTQVPPVTANAPVNGTAPGGPNPAASSPTGSPSSASPSAVTPSAVTPSGTSSSGEVALIAPRPTPATSVPPAVPTILPSTVRPTLPASAKSNAAPAGKSVADASTPAVPVEPAPDVKLVSKSVLLGYDSARDDWFVLQRPGLTLPNPNDTPADAVRLDPDAKAPVPHPPVPMAADRRADQWVAPDPFDSTLDVGDGLCRVWVLGGTSVQLLAPINNARFGFELHEGRIVMRSGGSTMPGTDYKPLVVALKVGDEIWQLTFRRPETQVGIEIIPGLPTRPGEDAKDISYGGGLYVVSGELVFTETVGRQRTLTAGRGIHLGPMDRAVATDPSGFAIRAKSGTVLAWLNPDSRRIPGPLLKMAREFEGDFLPDQPVSASIGTVAKNDPNPKVAELAVKTLALTNQYPILVEVLAQVKHEEAVHAAAIGLRTWLPRAPHHGGLLEKELNTSFPPGTKVLGPEMDDRAIVLRLLWGYNPETDARDRKTAEQLVGWLDHDRLAIRLLAIDQIRELTGGATLHYRAGMPTQERKRIKKEWERYLKQNKGLVPQ